MNCLLKVAKISLHATTETQKFSPIAGLLLTRNTYILKRRWPNKYVKKGVTETRLKGRDYVYDLIENTELSKKPDVQILLKKMVDGVGQKGDIVTMRRYKAYNDLILPGFADFATPELIEADKKRVKDVDAASSVHVPITVKYLEKLVLAITMSKENEWTLEPWHVKVCFRKAGVFLTEDCLTLPEKPIKGPDMGLENKDFVITVTINNKEKASVRCRIHHWSTNVGDMLPYMKYPWTIANPPLFPEDAPVLARLPVFKLKEKVVFQ